MSRARGLLVAFLAALALGPAFLPEFHVTLLNYIGLYSLVALGLVLLTGVGGLTSFGQAAFVGLGAYTTAYLTTAYAVSPWIALFVGFALTGTVALFLGAITLRLSGHYLPLGTIAWGISLYYLFGNLEFLGGQTGNHRRARDHALRPAARHRPQVLLPDLGARDRGAAARFRTCSTRARAARSAACAAAA